MRKFLLTLFLVATIAICPLVHAYTTTTSSEPNVEEGNRIKFTEEGQGTSVIFAISSIHWVSASGDEIGGTSGFILRSGSASGSDVASCEATTVSDQCHFTFAEPVIVDGLYVPKMSGDLYIYGKRK